MSEQIVRPRFVRLRDGVTVAQGALLLVAVILIGTLLSGAGLPGAVRAQENQGPRGQGPRGPGPGGFQGPPPAFGGGPMGQERKVLSQFDTNQDARLSVEERKAARTWLAKTPAAVDRWRAGRGAYAGTAGRALKPTRIKRYTTEPLYDTRVSGDLLE